MNPIKSTIYELKEDETLNLDSSTKINGDYNISLTNTPINILPNDQLLVKSAFIDSEAVNSNKIEITDDDTNVTTSQYLYMTNNLQDAKVYDLEPSSSNNSDRGAVQDCQKYIVSKLTNSITVNEVTNIRFNFEGASKGIPLGYGGITITMQYVNAHDPTHTDGTQKLTPFKVDIPHIGISSTSNTKFFDVNAADGYNPGLIPLHLASGTEITYPSNQRLAMKKKGVSSQFASTVAESVKGATCVPVLFQTNFTLQKGFFLPGDLAKIITDKMSALTESPTNNVITSANPCSSNYLKSVTQLHTYLGLVSNSDKESKLVLVREDGNKIINIPVTTEFPAASGFTVANAPANFLIGASEVGLEFDDALQKFDFGQLHSNCRAANEAIVVKVVADNKGTPTGNFKLSGSNGGIVFAGLQPQSLWQKLGFIDNTNNANSLLVTSNIGLPANLGNYTNVTTSSFNIIDGQHSTSQYAGLDVIYPTDGSQTVITLANSAPNEGIAVNIVEKVVALNGINNHKDNSSWFLIEITGIEQTLNGSRNIMTGVQSIISRFYNTDQITSAYSEGSIPYVHKGAAITLSNIRIRILNPKKEVAENLGNRTCIYLQHDTLK